VRELWFWRVVAVVACVGWGTSVWRAEPAANPSAPAELPVRTREPRPSAGAAVAPLGMTPQRPLRSEASAPAAVAAQGGLSEEALAVAREEVRSEMAARREAHEEERLADFLDRADAFARDHELRPEQTERLVAAITAMHDRVRALHGDPMADDGPPPEDRRERMHASFEQMDADLRAALGDDLAEAFHQSMGPPGPPPAGR
jgi:hypothetical protein